MKRSMITFLLSIVVLAGFAGCASSSPISDDPLLHCWILSPDSQITNTLYLASYTQQIDDLLRSQGSLRGSYAASDEILSLAVEKVQLPKQGFSIYPEYDQQRHMTFWIHQRQETHPVLQVSVVSKLAEDERVSGVSTYRWEYRWQLALAPEHQELPVDQLMELFFSQMLEQSKFTRTEVYDRR